MKWIESPVAEIWPFEYSKMAVRRHLGFGRTGNSAIRSARAACDEWITQFQFRWRNHYSLTV